MVKKDLTMLAFSMSFFVCQTGWTQGIRVVEIPTGPPPTSIDALPYLNLIKTHPASNPLEITLNNEGRIDIMPFIREAETRLDRSLYQNTAFIRQIYFGNIYDKIQDLCRSITDEDQKSLCEEDFTNVMKATQLRWQARGAARVLYPDDYVHLSRLRPNTMETAFDALQSNCPSQCQDFFVADTIVYGSRSEYDIIVHRLDQIGPDCILQALVQIMQTRLLDQYRLLPSLCEDRTDSRDRQVCNGLQRDYQTVARRLTFLITRATQEGLAPSNVSYLQNPSLFIAEVRDILQNKEDLRSCQAYEPGEERMLGFSLEQKAYRYKVKKELDGSYTVFLALSFSPEPEGYDGPLAPHQIHPHYYQRATSCVSQANNKMRGPHGERLNIVLLDAHQDNSCLPKHNITIKAAQTTSSILSYASDIDCSGIAHEVLHPLNLFDEYAKDYGFFGYDCRVLQINSLMASDVERWNNVFVTQQEESLLDPAHFNAIIYGNCSQREDVRLFRQCSALSYQTSYENEQCLQQRAECERQNVLGRDKHQEIQRIQRLIERLENGETLEDLNIAYMRRLHDTNPIRELQRKLELVMAWPE